MIKVGEENKLSRKIERSISPVRSNDDRNVGDFFNSIIEGLTTIESITIDVNKKEVAFILVCHMAPTLFPFLDAIRKIGNIAILIPKGFQRDNAKKIIGSLKENKKDLIGDGYFMDPFECSTASDPDPDILKNEINSNGIDLINEHVIAKNYKKFVIIDIGGYFSETFNKIISGDIDDIRDCFVGIVEDTENGHQKYIKMLQELWKNLLVRDNVTEQQKRIATKIYSVARCALKNTEDYNVGKSIVEASGTIIRVDGHAILERMAVAGVLGFGKIGRSIAEHLRQKNLREVVVYDPDILRQMEASSLGFKVVSRPYLIKQSQIIFCATGSKCLKAEDFIYIQHNVFIASCTSAEDELDFSFRDIIKTAKEGTTNKSGDILKLKIYDKSINLLDEGNAVNFVHGAVNGPYIYSVQAGLIVSAMELIKLDSRSSDQLAVTSQNIINELQKQDMQFVARKWLEYFDKCDSHVDLHKGAYLLHIRNDCDQKAIYPTVCQYLEKYWYLECKKLQAIVDCINSIMMENSVDSCLAQFQQTVKEVLKLIKNFLDEKQFASVMGYFSNLLLTIIPTMNIEKIHLLFLRTQSDLLIENGKEVNDGLEKLCAHLKIYEDEGQLAQIKGPMNDFVKFFDTLPKKMIPSNSNTVILMGYVKGLNEQLSGHLPMKLECSL